MVLFLQSFLVCSCFLHLLNFFKAVQLAATLLHEMARLYNLVHDIQDVSNNGY